MSHSMGIPDPLWQRWQERTGLVNPSSQIREFLWEAEVNPDILGRFYIDPRNLTEVKTGPAIQHEPLNDSSSQLLNGINIPVSLLSGDQRSLIWDKRPSETPSTRNQSCFFGGKCLCNNAEINIGDEGFLFGIRRIIDDSRISKITALKGFAHIECIEEFYSPFMMQMREAIELNEEDEDLNDTEFVHLPAAKYSEPCLHCGRMVRKSQEAFWRPDDNRTIHLDCLESYIEEEAS